MLRRSILLVSRDDELQFVRSRLLQDAGYQAFLVDSVSGGVLLVATERPQIALLCSSFTVDEGMSFVRILGGGSAEHLSGQLGSAS